MFREELEAISNGELISKKIVNDVHLKLCNKIKDIYGLEGIILIYGQAQTWLNMTIK